MGIASSAVLFLPPILNQGAVGDSSLPSALKRIKTTAEQHLNKYEQLKNQGGVENTLSNFNGLLAMQDVWVHILNDISDCLRSSNPDVLELESDPTKALSVRASDRRLIQLLDLKSTYIPSTKITSPGKIGIEMNVRFSNSGGNSFMTDTVVAWLRDHLDQDRSDINRESVPYTILEKSIEFIPVSPIISAGINPLTFYPNYPLPGEFSTPDPPNGTDTGSEGETGGRGGDSGSSEGSRGGRGS